MSNTKIKGIELSLRAFASMRVLRVFASTTSDQIQLTSGDHFVFSAGSKVPDVVFITSYRDPGYDMYNCVNLCYCCVLSSELNSQPGSLEFITAQRCIYVPRETFKIRFRSIYEILSNRANFNENASMLAVAKILRARASEHSFNFCGQIEQKPHFASSRTF